MKTANLKVMTNQRPDLQNSDSDPFDIMEPQNMALVFLYGFCPPKRDVIRTTCMLDILPWTYSLAKMPASRSISCFMARVLTLGQNSYVRAKSLFWGG